MKGQDAFRTEVERLQAAIIDMTKEMKDEDKSKWLQTLYTSYLNRMFSDNERIWRTGALFVPLSLSAFAAYANTKIQGLKLLVISIASIFIIGAGYL
jgi:hypothetical protein